MHSKLFFPVFLGGLFLLGLIFYPVYGGSTFSEKFGSSGSSDGKFDLPSGLALDTSNDMLYVADTDNDRIQVFDEDGDFEFKFGTSGSGEDQFKKPTAMLFDPSNDLLYVADTDNDRIQVFDEDGDFKFEFGTSGSSNGQFNSPSGLALDTSNDLLYVADTDNNRIQVFEIVDEGDSCPSGTTKIVDRACFVEKFGTSGSSNGQFNSPSGLALDTSNDLLYVADTDNNRIQVFDEDWDFDFKFGAAGSSDGQFRFPTAILFDTSNDLLYVADTDNNRIQVFEIVDGNTCPSGTTKIVDRACFVEKFGTSGSSNGQFNSPSGLALDTSNDLLYVADTENNQIQIFTISQTTSSSTKLPIPPKNFKALALSPTTILLSWDALLDQNNISTVTGYKIEYKEGSSNYSTITQDTKNTSTSFLHEGLDSTKTYSYKVSGINSQGVGDASVATGKPAHTTEPPGLTAIAISPNQIKLSWYPPSDTFGQSISGYEIKKKLSNDVFDPIGQTNSNTQTYVVSNLTTDKEYSFVVSAKIGFGQTNESNVVTTTPTQNSVDTSSNPGSSTLPPVSGPGSPTKLTASSISSTQIDLSWSSPSTDDNSSITGYKIEAKTDSGSYSVLVENTKNSATTYSHKNLSSNSKYTYRVYAINSSGLSSASNETSATPGESIQISPIGTMTIDEGKTISFTVKLESPSTRATFSLDQNPPSGAFINSSNGLFNWTPNSSQGGKSYVFDVVAKLDSLTDRELITIIVNDVKTDPIKEPVKEPVKEPEPTTLGIASFVDPKKDPQSYVDRYNNEPTYKEWFDKNFPEYSSIYEAVGLEEKKELPIASFVDPKKDPQSYVDRYNNEPTYKEWFDKNFPEYSSIYEAVGLDEEDGEKREFGFCGDGTKLIDGVCTVTGKVASKPWWKFW